MFSASKRRGGKSFLVILLLLSRKSETSEPTNYNTEGRKLIAFHFDEEGNERDKERLENRIELKE